VEVTRKKSLKLNSLNGVITRGDSMRSIEYEETGDSAPSRESCSQNNRSDFPNRGTRSRSPRTMIARRAACLIDSCFHREKSRRFRVHSSRQSAFRGIRTGTRALLSLAKGFTGGQTVFGDARDTETRFLRSGDIQLRVRWVHRYRDNYIHT